jgi:hypothetical protein
VNQALPIFKISKYFFSYSDLSLLCKAYGLSSDFQSLRRSLRVFWSSSFQFPVSRYTPVRILIFELKKVSLSVLVVAGLMK